jgi:hypothetical protein
MAALAPPKVGDLTEVLHATGWKGRRGIVRAIRDDGMALVSLAGLDDGGAVREFAVWLPLVALRVIEAAA